MIGSPLVTRRGDKPRFDGEELVIVASPMFPHRLAMGYSTRSPRSSRRSTACRIKNLRHLVETLRDAKDKFIDDQLRRPGPETIVFDRQEVLDATDEILSDNGVRQQASDDLRRCFVEEKSDDSASLAGPWSG